jgi:Rieske Fe-S protein
MQEEAGWSLQQQQQRQQQQQQMSFHCGCHGDAFTRAGLRATHALLVARSAVVQLP